MNKPQTLAGFLDASGGRKLSAQMILSHLIREHSRVEAEKCVKRDIAVRMGYAIADAIPAAKYDVSDLGTHYRLECYVFTRDELIKLIQAALA
jgi:hypothetical protein